MQTFIARLSSKTRAFGSDRKGNVAIIFGLALLPMTALVGAAVDYSRASSVRADFQAALDATALMISKTASTSTAAQLQTQAHDYFLALFTRSEAISPNITAVYSSSPTSSVTITGDTAVAPMFMAIPGVPQIKITSSSTVAWGNTRLRVALVLDNTGSMAANGKMTALKTASHNLLSSLQNAATAGPDVYVSIVPFAKDVNLDPANYTQTWVRWDLWDEVNGTCSKSSFTTKTTCTSAGKTWTVKNHNTWNGCVTDRDQPNDTNNTAATSGVLATKYPAEQYTTSMTAGGACPTAVMPLSNSWTTLNNKIDAMQPSGGTNQGIGLQVGFQTLTAAPFTVPALDVNYKYSQVIILLSDGLNTQDRWYGNGVDPSPQVDARQAIACKAAKDAGMVIYAVQVNTSSPADPMSQVLHDCASDESKFFMLTSATQIVTTFDQIGTNLSNLRVAK